ncbi:uncharacterized protein K452DRAFT_306034 [Aplosporella prunicola CBS 121167]|uniref:Fungal N-terminal domain-containing protein n=1 Tax=Aplosporella prunicola CBS 121167 TaxID=1176127 RepID=A0A6A6BN26_9PEZI|nr:uncharacterized protein K452DRAFT_306034 [Aplosporella prunicola CBS 121167]KAF2145098.1 hypothetical protein K452DRAFT_306034 [Aplosporella prunicola CBS 121167]
MSGLEAAANILALIGAAQDVSRLTVRLLKRLKHAPVEFRALLEEVENMQLVLARVEQTHEALEKSPSDLKRLIEAAERKMLVVNRMIQDKLIKPGKANKVDRFSWVRHSSKAKQLVLELSSLRQSIVDVLSALNWWVISRLFTVGTCTVIFTVSDQDRLNDFYFKG